MESEREEGGKDMTRLFSMFMVKQYPKSRSVSSPPK